MTLSLCSKWCLVDIALNLTDSMYSGKYQSHQRHKPDVEHVLDRATQVGVHGIMLTGGDAKTSAQCIQLCKMYGTSKLQCYATVGCHPTHCQDFENDPEGYYAQLDDLLTKHSVHAGGCVAAIGEMGLDYDRLFFCPKELQMKYFLRQLDLAERHRLPLFLHDRNTGGDFFEVMSCHSHRIAGGVVHSFTGSLEDLRRYLELGLFIGINGCSLKTEENLDVVKQVPLHRLMIETDGPWCDIRNTHASRAVLNKAGVRYGSSKCVSDEILEQYKSCRKEKYVEGCMVKSRCEPCNVVQVLEVLYELHREDVASIEELAKIIFENTCRLFPFSPPSASTEKEE